jgi:hypothetical protein
MPSRATPANVVALDYAAIFNAAVKATVRAKFRLLAKYQRLPFGAPLPGSYELDLRSYCVVASATIEQCVEDLVWAHLLEMCQQVSRVAVTSTEPYLLKSSTKLRDYGERTIHGVHGIKEEDFRKLASSVGITPIITTLQHTSFEQLGQLRGESAHTYVVRLADPKDVWAYTKDVLAATRALAVQCSGGTGTFVSI